MKDNNLPMLCDKCGEQFKELYPIYDSKGNMISRVCEKCAKELK